MHNQRDHNSPHGAVEHPQRVNEPNGKVFDSKSVREETERKGEDCLQKSHPQNRRHIFLIAPREKLGRGVEQRFANSGMQNENNGENNREWRQKFLHWLLLKVRRVWNVSVSPLK